MDWSIVGHAFNAIPPFNIVANDKLRFVCVFLLAVVTAKWLDIGRTSVVTAKALDIQAADGAKHAGGVPEIRQYGVTRSLGTFSWVTPRGVQSHIQEERVMKIIHWIGIDDHADKWTIAQFKGEEEKPAKEFELVPDDGGYRKLIKFLKELEGEVRIVYEAGPCGYELYRRLKKAKLQCDVAAPSLTPRKPGERVKTNRRDASKLGRYLRAGMLTLISVAD
jgi:hypothetical protein